MAIYLGSFLVFGYLGAILSKYFFFIINKQDFYFYFHKNFERSIKQYLLIPLDGYFILRSLDKKDKKYSKLLKIGLTSEILGLVVSGIFGLELLSSYSTLSAFSFLIYNAVILFFLSALLYLAVYDIVTFSIPFALIRNLTILAIFINIAVNIVKFLSESFGHPLLTNVRLGNIDNLISGVLFGLLIWIIVKVSKEKAMGEGDIYFVLVLGFILGWPNTLISFLATLIVGSIISILYSLYIQKFKEVLVPFVPFLVLGFIIALTFGQDIYSKLFFI